WGRCRRERCRRPDRRVAHFPVSEHRAARELHAGRPFRYERPILAAVLWMSALRRCGLRYRGDPGLTAVDAEALTGAVAGRDVRQLRSCGRGLRECHRIGATGIAEDGELLLWV